jgi:hypothetical protein
MSFNCDPILTEIAGLKRKRDDDEDDKKRPIYKFQMISQCETKIRKWKWLKIFNKMKRIVRAKADIKCKKIKAAARKAYDEETKVFYAKLIKAEAQADGERDSAVAEIHARTKRQMDRLRLQPVIPKPSADFMDLLSDDEEEEKEEVKNDEEDDGEWEAEEEEESKDEASDGKDPAPTSVPSSLSLTSLTTPALEVKQTSSSSYDLKHNIAPTASVPLSTSSSLSSLAYAYPSMIQASTLSPELQSLNFGDGDDSSSQQ